MTATETNAPDEPDSADPGVGAPSTTELTTAEPTSTPPATTKPPTMYTTSWCGFCARLKRGLLGEGIDYAEVDIEEVEGAAELVMARNGGNRTVPTVVFADGSALTNPSVAEVRERLARTA